MNLLNHGRLETLPVAMAATDTPDTSSAAEESHQTWTLVFAETDENDHTRVMLPYPDPGIEVPVTLSDS